MTDAGKENTEQTVVEGKGRTQLEIMNNGSISLSFFASSSISGKRGQMPPCINCCQNGYEEDPKTPVQERMHTLALRIWVARSDTC